MSERLLVVKNKNATGASRVESEVLAPLDNAGVPYDVFQTPSPDFEDNVNAMREAFRADDRIVIAAGDGTVSQAVNALARSGYRDAELAALPLGGFVDLSEKKARILDVLGDGVETQTRYPMAIHIDDELWRYSPGYTTLGFTAIAASSFASPESRARLSDRSNLARRLGQVVQLGNQYFEHRKGFLPAFHTSHSATVRDAVTDIMLINNERAGGIMRFPKDFGAGESLGVVEKDVSRVNLDNIRFGIAALAGSAPSSEQYDHRIQFVRTGDVPIQTEGEFALLKDVDSIAATKDPEISYQAIKPLKFRR